MTQQSDGKEELEPIEDAMMRVAMGVQKGDFLPHDVHQEALDLLAWHSKEVAKAKVEVLQWAAYAIGDLHMERIGNSDFDLATARVEAYRQHHHSIIQARIAHLGQGKDGDE
jgi:hypothetical protein